MPVSPKQDIFSKSIDAITASFIAAGYICYKRIICTNVDEGRFPDLSIILLCLVAKFDVFDKDSTHHPPQIKLETFGPKSHTNIFCRSHCGNNNKTKTRARKI